MDSIRSSATGRVAMNERVAMAAGEVADEEASAVVADTAARDADVAEAAVVRAAVEDETMSRRLAHP